MANDLNVPIGIIPGGTFNDFTKTLNLNPNFSKASEQLKTSHLESYDVMKVNGTYVLNFVGLGLIVQNAENVQEGRKDIFGKLSYVGSTVKTLMNPEDFDYTLTVDDKELNGNTSMLVVANGPNIGGSRIPLMDLSPQDGKLNSFILINKVLLFSMMCSKRDSMDWNEITNGIDHIAGKHITLSTDPVMKVDIDGEISLETPITIEVLPKALQILTFPENAEQ